MYQASVNPKDIFDCYVLFVSIGNSMWQVFSKVDFQGISIVIPGGLEFSNLTQLAVGNNAICSARITNNSNIVREEISNTHGVGQFKDCFL